MVNLINVNPKKHNKDCLDWCPLNDYTLTGDIKYCNLSLQCRQLNMKTDWHWFYNPATGEQEYDYLCTGMKVTEENKRDDDEVS